MNWTFPYCPNEGNFAINWRELLDKFEWLRVLADCPQDARYHAEGDVLTHTKLVCEALIALPEWQALPETQRSVLFAAALLHDVAKPHATKIEHSGAISSKGHVLQGAKMAREILWDLNVPFRQREEIVALVKYGSLPLWFWDKSNPEQAVIKASQIIRCDMLAMLAEADVKGRYCDDQNQLFERIDFFREFCQENHCFTQSRSFPSAHSRFIYFQKEDRNPDYHAYDNTRFQVVMMCGLPGSGKDTWIQENLSDYKEISLDKLRHEMRIEHGGNQGEVANAAKYLAKEYMRAEESFVWNATNLNKQLREMLISLFAAYQAEIRIVYLEVPWLELLRRNKTRVDKVPERILYRMKNRLEIPTIIEAHHVDWIAN
mgnify:FL=1